MCLTISYSTIPKLSFTFFYRYTHQRLAIVSFSHSLNITSLFSKNTCYHYNAFRKYQPSTTTKFSFHTPLNLLSLSLWLGCWPVEDLFHSTSLGHVGLEILGGVCYPGRVKLGGVLVHQVGVFGAPRSSKVLDLKKQMIQHSWNHIILCSFISFMGKVCLHATCISNNSMPNIFFIILQNNLQNYKVFKTQKSPL